ncbi:MAG: Rha family transcriptional regulator [Promethearchaeota archaeon]
MSDSLTIKEGRTEYGVTTIDGEKAIVSSRDVADVFDKDHSKVLRDIRNLKCSDKFRESNFGLSKYKAGNRKYKEYLLTKDGLVFLVMGYTGKKAAKFKEAYIEQFNKMEKLIRNRHFAKIEYKPMTDAIKEYRENRGEKIKFYHFTNEADMLNRIVLGMTSKEYREKHDIDKSEVRDHLPNWQLKAIKHLQRLNTDLIHSGLEYDDRKEILRKRFDKMYNKLELTDVDNAKLIS